jgi:tryptophanyl-tRNA synthetase
MKEPNPPELSQLHAEKILLESTESMSEVQNSLSRPRVLSGMRPTGKLHLGNYMGALANWVKLQDEYECYFFIADLHALTTDYADPSRLKLNTLDVALDYLAAGLDPERSTIFIQSHVPQHAELHLLFSMITPLGWLERVPSYKEQQENIAGKDLHTYGFLGYPLLQAADILIYQPRFVPVGQDQVAHVELTREVARRFNSMYRSTVFPEPDALLTPSPRIPGTDGRKMSKSYGNTIGLTEPPAVVAFKVHSMSTGGQRTRPTDAGNPDLCPVGDLHKVFSSPEVLEETRKGCMTATIPCEFCKIEAGRSLCAVTEPIHRRRMQLESDIDKTWEMLRAQSAKAEARAEETMLSVRPVFDLSRDLGAVRRHFTFTAKSREHNRDLSAFTEWQKLDAAELSKRLRDYWKNNLLPFDVPLSRESNRIFTTPERELEEPFLSAKKKRVLVIASRDSEQANEWNFEIPAKSYEVWALLCWHDLNNRLDDFVIPQKYYSQGFAAAKKLVAKDGKIPVIVKRDEGNRFFLSVAGSTLIAVHQLRGNYEPLQ